MTVTVEVMNQKTFNLLNTMESMGLIHVRPSVSPDGETCKEVPPPYAGDEKRSFQRFYGIHAGRHKGSAEDFLADCRADKEREYAIEKREEAERMRMRLCANATVSS